MDFDAVEVLHGHVVLCVPQNIIHCVRYVAMLFAWWYYGKITWCSQSHVALESFQMQQCWNCLALLDQNNPQGTWGSYCGFGAFFLLKRVEV